MKTIPIIKQFIRTCNECGEACNFGRIHKIIDKACWTPPYATRCKDCARGDVASCPTNNFPIRTLEKVVQQCTTQRLRLAA